MSVPVLHEVANEMRDDRAERREAFRLLASLLRVVIGGSGGGVPKDPQGRVGDGKGLLEVQERSVVSPEDDGVQG